MDLRHKKTEIFNQVKKALSLIAPSQQIKTLKTGQLESNRLIDVDFVHNQWQVQLNSDGMSLNDKIDLEQKLLQKLHKEESALPFYVYYKRTKASSPNTKYPKPTAAKPSPFGLKIDKKSIPLVKEVIVVASGKGGVGKSTVSTNLAVALSKQNFKVGLLDADVYGPSAPTMFNIQGPMKINIENRLLPIEAYGVKVTSFGLLNEGHQPVIWRGPLVGKSITQLCYDVDWGELDYLIVDLPPGTGDVQLSLIETLPIQGAIIVSTPQKVALIDAHKALTMFERLEVPIIGLVENMASHSCSKCGNKEAIFGNKHIEDFISRQKIKRLASVPLDAHIRDACDDGSPVASKGHTDHREIFEQLANSIKNI